MVLKESKVNPFVNVHIINSVKIKQAPLLPDFLRLLAKLYENKFSLKQAKISPNREKSISIPRFESYLQISKLFKKSEDFNRKDLFPLLCTGNSYSK